MKRGFRVMGVAGLLGLPCTVLAAASGYQWEVSTEMSGMELPMAMPKQVTKVCTPAKAKETPGMDSKECQLLESRQSGGHYFWKARCNMQGEKPTVMSGDFTYQGETAYQGKITMEGEYAMTMKVSGKRLGACDYAASQAQARRQVEAAQASADRNMAALCDAAVRNLDPGQILGEGGLCTARKAEFCARFGQLSMEEYGQLQGRLAGEREMAKYGYAGVGGVSLAQAMRVCGQDEATMTARYCDLALKEENAAFLVEKCPEQAKQFALSKCVGRSYTAYSGLCERYVVGGRSYTAAPAAPSPRDPTSEAIDSGMRKLKGLFGF